MLGDREGPIYSGSQKLTGVVTYHIINPESQPGSTTVQLAGLRSLIYNQNHSPSGMATWTYFEGKDGGTCGISTRVTTKPSPTVPD